MQKTTLMLSFALVLAFALPAEAGHPHTKSADYTGAIGLGSDATGTILFPIVLCGLPEGCDDPDPTIAPIGGAPVWSDHPREDHYANIDTTGQDLTNAPLPMTSCIYTTSNPSGACLEGNGSGGEPDCSNRADVRGGSPGYIAVVFIYSAWVQGTTVCFGTTGSVDVSFF